MATTSSILDLTVCTPAGLRLLLWRTPSGKRAKTSGEEGVAKSFEKLASGEIEDEVIPSNITDVAEVILSKAGWWASLTPCPPKEGIPVPTRSKTINLMVERSERGDLLKKAVMKVGASGDHTIVTHWGPVEKKEVIPTLTDFLDRAREANTHDTVAVVASTETLRAILIYFGAIGARAGIGPLEGDVAVLDVHGAPYNATMIHTLFHRSIPNHGCWSSAPHPDYGKRKMAMVYPL